MRISKWMALLALIVPTSRLLRAEEAVSAQVVAKFNSSSLGGGSGASAGSADNFLFTGSLLYSVPIAVPPGISGVQPALALQYNSSAGNGWAGVGWTLSLGSIQRSTKNGVPKYDATDSFVVTLQGATHELVKVSNGIYRAKIEDGYQKFSFDGAQWIVTDKIGSRTYFGQTPGSRIAGAAGTFLWALDKVVDRNGNYFTASYTQPAGENQLYPYEILYTGNAGHAPDRKVGFSLGSRSDVLTNYQAGFLVKTTRLLSQVNTWVNINGNWTPAARYDLAYLTRATTNRSLLQSVTFTGFQAGASRSKVLARFDYPADTRGWEEHSEWAPPKDINSGSPNWIPNGGEFGDLNMDGLPDLSIASDQGGGAYDHSWINNGQTYVEFPQWKLPINESLGTFSTYNGTALGDLNGDGRNDFVYSRCGYPPARSWFNTPNGWVEHPELALPNCLADNNGLPVGARLTDINGDHLSDLVVAFEMGSEMHQTFINTGNGWVEHPEWRLPAGFNFTWTTNRTDSGAQLIDLNGDGRPDAVYALQGGARVTYINTGTGWQADSAWTLPDDLGANAGTNPGSRFVDVNGDGLPDFVVARGGGVDYRKTYLNTGHGWAERTEWQLPDFLSLSVPNNMWRQTWPVFADVNGDGLADFVYAYTDTDFQSTHVQTYLNTGSGWAAAAEWALPNYLGVTGGRNTGSRMLDINGDQFADFVISYFNQTAPYSHAWLSKAAPHGDLVSQITNAIGGVTQVTYDKSTNFTNTFLPFPSWVVKSITQVDGRVETPDPSLTYTYSGGYFDVKEKEFLGFAGVQATDAAGNYSVTTFLQKTDTGGASTPANALKGRVRSVKQYDAQNHLLQESDTQWNYVIPSSGVYFVRALSVQNIDWTASPAQTTEVDFTYDDAPGAGYGNVVQTLNKGDLAISGDERTEKIEYALNIPANLLSLPSRTEVSGPTPGKLSEALFFYDTYGNATEVRRWLDQPAEKYLSAKAEYNPAGQVTATIDAQGVRTETTYDGTYGFPISVKNAKDHIAQTTYDPLTGNRLTATSVNNQTTTYKYDPLGRLISVIAPLDSAALPTVSYDYHDEWMGDPASQRTEKKVRAQHGGSAVIWSRDYFDGLGRTYKTENQDAGGNSVIAETVFNNRGLADQVSTPRFSIPSSNPVWTQNFYDALGRVTQTLNPDGTITSSSYQGRTTTVQDANGKIQISYADSYGRVIARHEPSVANDTTYQYDPSGNLARLTDSAGKNTTFTYDSLGRKLSMTDPNAGTWHYEYDDNGNLTKQTDARHVALTFQYDQLNRLTRKILAADPDHATGQTVNTDLASYVYDSTNTSTNSTGRLFSASFGNGAGGSEYYYDELGNVVRDIQSIDGNSYEVKRTYDALGRVTQIIYPNDNQIVKYSYDDANHLSNVTNADGNFAYASFPSYDALGRALQMNQTNALTKTTYTFDPLKQTLQYLKMESWSTGSAVMLQNLSYSFDPVGNLKILNDFVHPERSQTFEYDDLNRLTRAQGSYGDEKYVYDSLGNFTKKGALSYQYGDASHPDAVKETYSASTPAQDSSTLLSWNFDPSEPIYQVAGRVLSSSGTAKPGMPVVISGLFDESVYTDTSTAAFLFRGVPGGSGGIYSLAVSSVGFSSSTPASFAYNALSQNMTAQDFRVDACTSSINVTKLRIPRTAAAHGSPFPFESSGTYQGGLIGGLGFGGQISTGTGNLSQLSGYKPLGDGNDLTPQATAQYVLPPVPTATGVQGPSFVAGKYQQALSFNGTSDIFAFPNTQSIAPTALTMMLWAKPTTTPTAGTYATLLAKSTGSAVGTLSNGFRMLMNSNGKLVFEIGRANVGSAVLSSAQALNLNKWNFVCASYDGATMRIYLNGQETGTLAFSGAVISNSYLATAGASLNAEKRIVTGSFFTGNLDEPRLHNRAWTPAEIAATQDLYNNSATYTYDANGNRLTKTTALCNWSYQYDAEGRLTTVKKDGATVSSFVYNENGERVKKIVGSTSTATTLYVGKLFEKRPDQSWVDHIYGGGTLICDLVQLSTGSIQAYYYHADHLGSVALVTNAQGQKIQEMSYQPFGKTQTLEGGSPNHFKYTNQEEDPESELYFYNARFYDPAMGRFISPDSIVPSAMDPQSLNRYAYCENNPIISTDPDGHFAILIPIIIGAVIGAAEGGTHGHLFNGDAWHNFDWKLAAVGAGAGAVSGAVGFGIGTAIGPGLGAMGLAGDIGVGAIAGSLAAGSGYITSSILTGQPIDGNTLGKSMLTGAVVGGVTGGLTSSHLGSFLSGQENFAGKTIQSQIAATESAEKSLTISTEHSENSSLQNNQFRGKSEVEPFKISEHAYQRMNARGITYEEIENTINNSRPIQYYHEGVWKTGYYDTSTKIFVAQSEGVITTVMKAKPQYIYNLVTRRP